MPIETIIVLCAVIGVFVAFAATIAGVDIYSREARRTNHPLPGE
ncbi:hypothetical protein [Starkeya sp. ORNL1]|nr:hypothetical protein [Starkeya sp. ORNL1]